MKPDHHQNYLELSNKKQGELKRKIQPIINYTENPDSPPYASASRIIKEHNLETRPQELGLAIKAVSEIYETELDYTHDQSRAQWMIYKMEDLPLQKLADQILEEQ